MADIERKLTKKDIENLPIVGEKPKDEREEKFLREVRTFEFMNLDDPGMMIKFPYGSTKHSHIFTFMHGGKYKVPRFVARHVESCITPIWKWRADGTGAMRKEKIGGKPRFQMREIYE